MATAAEKAAAKAAKAAAKAAAATEPVLVKSQCDCFNGFVELWQDETEWYYIRQTRKDFTSDYLSMDDANKLFDELVSDTMF